MVIAICTTLATLVAGAIAALSLHKKISSADIKLLGETARVDTKLDPDGTVLVSGELWRAKSINDAIIPPRAHVKVVGFQDHMMLVKTCN